jgi:hypothetical protein
VKRTLIPGTDRPLAGTVDTGCEPWAYMVGNSGVSPDNFFVTLVGNSGVSPDNFFVTLVTWLQLISPDNFFCNPGHTGHNGHNGYNGLCVHGSP